MIRCDGLVGVARREHGVDERQRRIPAALHEALPRTAIRAPRQPPGLSGGHEQDAAAGDEPAGGARNPFADHRLTGRRGPPTSAP